MGVYAMQSACGRVGVNRGAGLAAALLIAFLVAVLAGLFMAVPSAFAEASSGASSEASSGIDESDVDEYLDILGSVFAITPQSKEVHEALDAVKVKSMGKAEVTVASCVYDGEGQKPDVTVTVDGERLDPANDYSVEYENNVNAGTGVVRVVGKGDFFGMIERDFVIEKADFHDAKVTGVKARYVDMGEPIAPEPTIAIGENTLEKDVDYTVSYENNTEVGKATINIVGIGNYSGKMTANYEIVADEAEPVIDQAIMMVDVKHFNIADLTASLSTDETRWKPSDIVWTTGDPNVALFWDYKDNLLTEISGERATVQGMSYGETTITATLPNGKSATCNFKVMTSCLDSSVGSAYYWVTTTFYLVEGSWGTEYVEAYVNNADRMVKSHASYANFEDDYPERTVYGYWQSDLSVTWPDGSSKFNVSGHRHHWNKAKGNWFDDETVLVKQEGELSPNDWLLLQTSKNQWEYLLHKEDGTWHVVDEREGSAGPHYERFNGYMGVVFNSQWGLAATIGSNKRGQTLKSVLLHSGGQQGRPTTHGCIALGGYSSKLYYDTFVLAGLGTRVIAY